MSLVDIEKTIREYLPNVVHMSLSTTMDGKPWVCEVHFAYDQDLNLYFRSKRDRRHSREIAQNPYVAGNIVTQHMIGQKVRGVYFEGRAVLLEDIDEQHPAFVCLCERFNRGNDILEESKTEDGHKFYKILVDTFYVFDSRESTPGEKYELPWSISK